ncbi:MAG TPA: hypothetical protein VIV14_06595 [Gammaproteobacteria bacterium]
MSQENAEDLIRSFRQRETEAGSEHISMDSAGATDIRDAEVTTAIELRNLCTTFQCSNRLHGQHFQYELYKEGYVKIKEWKRKKLVRSYYVALRFLDLKHKVTRIVAWRTMMSATGLLIAAVIAEIVSLSLPYDRLFGSVAILLGCGAAISFLLFLYWSQERTHFLSATGGCEVLRLTGTVESIRTCRSIARALTQAIEDARAHEVDDWPVYLRKEMHDHYRLQRAGAISEEACARATRQILNRFD